MEYAVGLITATIVIVAFFFIFTALMKTAAKFIIFLLICAGAVGASLVNIQAGPPGRTLLEQDLLIYLALCVGISLVISINSIPFLLLAHMHRQEKDSNVASRHEAPATQPSQNISNDDIHSSDVKSATPTA